MEYQVGQTVRIGNIKYEDNGKNHYVTKEMARVSGQVGSVVSKERYNSMMRYAIKISDETLRWFEDAWLVPHLIDNRSI